MSWKPNCIILSPARQMDNNASTLGVVVLAGGQARRMGGVDKGLVNIAERPMVAWVLDAIKPLGCAVALNANRNTDTYARYATEVIADTVSDFPGPLAGLLVALDHFDTEWVMMCPCDSPFVETGLLQTLWEHAQSSDESIVVAHDGERLQPVFAAVKRSLRSSLSAYLDGGDRKIDRWYEGVGYSAVDCSDFPRCFDNINTPEEQLAAEQRLLG